MLDSTFDRRKHYRVMTGSSVSFRRRGVADVAAARLVDLSQGGMRFVCLNCEATPGELLDVTMSNGEHSADVMVRVIRVASRDDGSFDVAASFVEEAVATVAPPRQAPEAFVKVTVRSIAWVQPDRTAAPSDTFGGAPAVGIRFRCVGVAIEPSQVLRVRIELRGRTGSVVGRVAWIVDRDRFHREVALTVLQGDCDIVEMLEAESDATETADVPALC